MDKPGFESRQGLEIFSSPQHSYQLWGPPSPVFDGYWGSFLGVKWLGMK